MKVWKRFGKLLEDEEIEVEILTAINRADNLFASTQQDDDQRSLWFARINRPAKSNKPTVILSSSNAAPK